MLMQQWHYPVKSINRVEDIWFTNGFYPILVRMLWIWCNVFVRQDLRSVVCLQIVINVEEFGLRLIVTVNANRETRSAGYWVDWGVIGKFLYVSIHGEKTIRIKKHQKDQRNDQKLWLEFRSDPPTCGNRAHRILRAAVFFHFKLVLLIMAISTTKSWSFPIVDRCAARTKL